MHLLDPCVCNTAEFVWSVFIKRDLTNIGYVGEECSNNSL